ncbi:hypothetical protein KsCSTR_23250 [Candidatus Kuenenia stuttgartiensis]|uniref:Uncharacterized protein n=1 Tax=Kuenenia stuttgartiensis TaxID=174633 RepID=A0A6G7GQR6_KUEST|nr:hypothetical protein KsCSTR_23250 [Candidatus Kuenenia stuttgartiensis]
MPPLGLNAFMTIYGKCLDPTLRLLEFFKELKCNPRINF